VSDIAAFFQAVQSGDPSQVEALLDANASLANARNEKGQSAVLVAVYAGRKEIRDLMLARGIALELDEAAAAGQLARVQQLVDKDPALANNFSPDGFPVFTLAAAFGHREVAEYFVRPGRGCKRCGDRRNGIQRADRRGRERPRTAGCWTMALRLTTATAGVFAVAYGGGQRAPRNRENAAAA